MSRRVPDLLSRDALKYDDEEYGEIKHKIGPDQEMCCPEGKSPFAWCKYPDILYQDQKLGGKNHRRIDSPDDTQELQTNVSHRSDPGSFMQTTRAAYSDNIQESGDGYVPLMTTIAEICGNR